MLPGGKRSAKTEPLPPGRFRELTFEQAQAHLGAYLVAIIDRIQRLREDVPRRGGPARERLDGSPDSLELLWAWWRTGGAAQQDGPEWTWDDPDLPLWLPHVRPAHYRGWSAALLRDLDRIAVYAGQVILAADDTARWAVMVPPKGAPLGKRWHGHHEPVIYSRRVGPRNPRVAFTTMLRRELDPTADPLLRRGRVRLLLPPGVPDDPPVQPPVEGDWSVDGLRIDVGDPWIEQFDLTVEVDEFAEDVAGAEVFRTLGSRVAAVEGIDEALHEDREVLHLRARLPRPEVERIVRDALRTAPAT